MISSPERCFDLPQVVAKRVSDIRICCRYIAGYRQKFAQAQAVPTGIGWQAQRAEAVRLECADLVVRQTVCQFTLRRSRCDIVDDTRQAERNGQRRNQLRLSAMSDGWIRVSQRVALLADSVVCVHRRLHQTLTL
jgi:hypothetical protein